MAEKEYDEYKTIKTSFNSILINNEEKITVYKKIYDVCDRTHRLVIQVCQFLRLWILFKYHQNLPIPKITENVITLAFLALVKNPKRDQIKKANLPIFDKFIEFYNVIYSEL